MIENDITLDRIMEIEGFVTREAVYTSMRQYKSIESVLNVCSSNAEEMNYWMDKLCDAWYEKYRRTLANYHDLQNQIVQAVKDNNQDSLNALLAKRQDILDRWRDVIAQNNDKRPHSIPTFVHSDL